MKSSPDGINRVFLLVCAVGLLPIALSYGAVPSISMQGLFGIPVDTLNLTHILRAVMGLYLGMIVIWVLGAFRPSLTGPALICCAVFMLGLAFGRGLSILIDGLPHGLLSLYAVLEICLGAAAVYLYRRLEPQGG